LVEKPKRKITLGTPRSGCEDNIRVDLREGGKVWTGIIWLTKETSGGLL
jgi:hypothetical protein